MNVRTSVHVRVIMALLVYCGWAYEILIKKKTTEKMHGARRYCFYKHFLMYFFFLNEIARMHYAREMT